MSKRGRALSINGKLWVKGADGYYSKFVKTNPDIAELEHLKAERIRIKAYIAKLDKEGK